MTPEERTQEQYAEACAAFGLTHVWESLGTDAPTERLVRNIFGAVMLGALEIQDEVSV